MWPYPYLSTTKDDHSWIPEWVNDANDAHDPPESVDRYTVSVLAAVRTTV
jgi:hypothetical protein